MHKINIKFIQYTSYYLCFTPLQQPWGGGGWLQRKVQGPFASVLHLLAFGGGGEVVAKGSAFLFKLPGYRRKQGPFASALCLLAFVGK